MSRKWVRIISVVIAVVMVLTFLGSMIIPYL